jgi:hypothetical protein
VVFVQRHPLAVHLQLAAAPQRHVDLLLVVVGVVVARVAVELRRQVDHLHPERLHAQLRPRPFEAAEQRRVHLVDLLHRVIRHRVSLLL